MEDKTFKSRDIYRLVANNLTKKEKKNVLLFFIVILPMSGVVIGYLEEILLTLFKPSKVVFLVLRLLKIFNLLFEKAVDVDTSVAVWALLPKEDREEALKAIESLQDDFFLLK